MLEKIQNQFSPKQNKSSVKNTKRSVNEDAEKNEIIGKPKQRKEKKTNRDKISGLRKSVSCLLHFEQFRNFL